jgi:hypothetical protein
MCQIYNNNQLSGILKLSENGRFGESYSQVIQRILDGMETEAHLIRIIMMTDVSGLLLLLK